MARSVPTAIICRPPPLAADLEVPPMPPRRPATGLRIAAAIAIVVAVAATGPGALDEGVRAAHLPAYPVVTTARVTPYVSGTTLTWTAFDQLAANGTAGPADAVRLSGAAGGAMGIVQTGRDNVAGRAASWRSTDGGRTWTEQLGPEGVDAFGQVVGRRGVLVTTGRSFLSSTDGETWTPAATGPQAIRTVTLATGPQGFVAFVRNGASTTTRVWLSATGASNSWVAAPAQSLVSSFCPTSVATSSTRMIAIGYDCRVPSRPRVLVSTIGRSWSAGTGAHRPSNVGHLRASAVGQLRLAALHRHRHELDPDVDVGLDHDRRALVAPGERHAPP